MKQEKKLACYLIVLRIYDTYYTEVPERRLVD
jgi:hypothetical protein